MDDDLAQFLVLVRALCVSAGLAGLEVETELADGAWVRGVPAAMKGPEAGEYVGDTGYHDCDIGVALRSVVTCRLLAPSAID